MKKGKLLVVLVGVAFILTMAFFVGNPQPTSAAEKCNIVTIFGRGNVTGSTVNVTKGDCVLWISWVKESQNRSEDVTIVFKEGASCIKAIRTPVGFTLDKPTGCFISQSIKYGQTVSLVFTEPGTYEYEVQFQVGGKETGKVIVNP